MKQKIFPPLNFFFILILFILFSFVLVLTSHLVSAECFQGIDGVCDYNCIDVDFDCIENPYQEGIIYEEQQSLLEDFFNRNTVDSEDKETGELISEDNFDEHETNIFDGLPDDELGDGGVVEGGVILVENDLTILSEDEYFEIIKEEDNSLPLGLIIGGGISILVLLGIILLIYLRVKHSKKIFATQQSQLTNYIIKLRDQKYSDAQIKNLFLDRGYDEQFINGLFKSLRF